MTGRLLAELYDDTRPDCGSFEGEIPDSTIIFADFLTRSSSVVRAGLMDPELALPDLPSRHYLPKPEPMKSLAFRLSKRSFSSAIPFIGHRLGGWAANCQMTDSFCRTGTICEGEQLRIPPLEASCKA